MLYVYVVRTAEGHGSEAIFNAQNSFSMALYSITCTFIECGYITVSVGPLNRPRTETGAVPVIMVTWRCGNTAGGYVNSTTPPWYTHSIGFRTITITYYREYLDLGVYSLVVYTHCFRTMYIPYISSLTRGAHAQWGLL